jgi:M6 family metalloprotease-like protein
MKRSPEDGVKGRNSSTVWWLFLIGALGVGQAFATPSPLGPQRVIVIPINLGTTLDELCPHGPFAFGRPCPFNSTTVTAYRQPRHTAHEWDALLNDYGTRFWQLASYGQTQVGFTVLENPYSPDGWWTPPHPAQDYENNEDFYVDHKWWAYVEDPARGAIDAVCAQPLPFYQYFCSILGQYDRIIVMTNRKERGGVTTGIPITVNTSTQGNLAFTASLVNEGYSDSGALSVIMHEFGHQLGIPVHYGDCSPWYTPKTQGYVECVEAWDIMGADWYWTQPTGYSRLNRSWIAPQTTLTYALQTQPFSTLSLIRPVEVAPNGVPNLIRLPTSLPNAVNFYGYHLECRQRINGDEGLYPQSTGIPEEGLLVTSVHEGTFAVVEAFMHVVRPTFPPGSPTFAALQPGESFTDAERGLFIRLNGYAGSGVDALCDVEVDYLAPPLVGPIVLWQNRVTPVPESGFGSYDIGWNHPAPPGAAGGALTEPLAQAPLWPGHENLLVLRAHTTGTLPVNDAMLDVSITEPALFSSECGSPRRGEIRQVELGPIDPVEGGYASLAFQPRRGSLGIQLVAPADPASGRDASNVVGSRFAYKFFPAGNATPQQTRFALLANDDCEHKASFQVTPAVVPAGWNVTVQPEIATLAPGRKKFVTVVVWPPSGAQPGANADIGIAVAETVDTHSPLPTDDPDHPVDSGLLKHTELVGWMEVFAKVVGEPARVELACGTAGRPRRPGEPISVSGSVIPPAASTRVMVEYTSPHGRETHFATTDAAGRFTDSFAPDSTGGTRVQAFWPGDATHAPAQSRRCVR